MDNNIKFIDLFSGIGGIRMAYEKEGYKCVFSSEINPHACEMYKVNFGEDPYCDITKVDANTIPDFDVLCAGFPCQAFSISGKQKGFYDETRGTLFFDICRILEAKQPKAFMLENVQNLEKHDNGTTLKVMLNSLENLGYTVQYKVLNAKDFDVPQNRERIIIIGNKLGKIFDFSKIAINTATNMKKYLDEKGDFEYLNSNEYTIIDNYKRQEKSGLIFIGYRNKKMRTNGVRPGTEHLSRVHKQPNRIYSVNGIHPTIASQETSGRYWIYDGEKVRKLTISECYRFMGFPEDFKKIGSNANLYERIGNSVCVNMIDEVAKQVKKQFFEKGDSEIKDIQPDYFLEKVYITSSKNINKKSKKLNETQIEWLNTILKNEETYKGVYTALFSSLTYKCLYPSQDVRLHQIDMKNGYSGRSFDTRWVTPFLKTKQFCGAMKESGWLTRSIEQPHPFNLEFPGKINNKDVKNAFLQILNDVQENGTDPLLYLEEMIKGSIKNKEKKLVKIINPIDRNEQLNISDIIEYLHKHFYYRYSTRGASILPVIAIYSIYECIIKELKRFNSKKLEPLNSHTSSDRSSGATGDIVVTNIDDGEIYEVVEVKFDIKPTLIMVQDAYNKIKETKIERYYILSTLAPDEDEKNKIIEFIEKVRKEHGCQIIVNGVFNTLEYYLRLIENTDSFINSYVESLKNDNEINTEHKIIWNKLLDDTGYMYAEGQISSVEVNEDSAMYKIDD